MVTFRQSETAAQAVDDLESVISMMKVVKSWQQAATQLKHETYAIYLAYKDPRTPWYARLFAALIVAYAFSPIDLIPDFIPVLGYLDDLLLIPLGIALVLRLIPDEVMLDCRQRSDMLTNGVKSGDVPKHQ